MKHCPYCKIDVGGSLTRCPFCQSGLLGTEDRPYWPPQKTLQTQSILYKLQLFFVLATIIVVLSLDFLLNLNPDSFHWSLLVSLWLITFEFGLIRLFKRNYSSSRILTLFVSMLAILILITGYFTDYWYLAAGILVPWMCIGTLIVNFILTLVNQIANAIVYLLSNILVGILPYLVLRIMGKDIPLAWIICLTTSVILWVASCIFRGREVLSELQRRFNL